MVSNNLWKSRWVVLWGGGGVFELRKSWGGGAQAAFEIQVEEGVKKPCLPSGEWGGGVGSGFFLE